MLGGHISVAEFFGLGSLPAWRKRQSVMSEQPPSFCFNILSEMSRATGFPLGLTSFGRAKMARTRKDDDRKPMRCVFGLLTVGADDGDEGMCGRLDLD